MFDGFRMEPVEVIDAGRETVFALERYGGCAKLSGVEATQLVGDAFTIRDGMIARARECETRAGALKAAGLSE